jgi:fused signal recognition particle receptor
MSLWDRLRQGLSRTRERLGAPLAKVLGRGVEPDPETIDALEEALLATDVGPDTTARLIAGARRRLRASPDLDLRQALEREAAELLAAHRAAFEPAGQKPWVALVTGVNGVGKTTLAGKLAAHFARQGRGTLLVAAGYVSAPRPPSSSTPAPGDSQGRRRRPGRGGPRWTAARRGDAVLVIPPDALHQQNLMAELEKVARVAGRVIEGAPHHTLLVLDATVGQNGVAQAREFQRAVPVTSLAINKLDGTARGGAVLAIADQLGLPISLVGVGEGLDDWAPFDPAAFARGLFE